MIVECKDPEEESKEIKWQNASENNAGGQSAADGNEGETEYARVRVETLP